MCGRYVLSMRPSQVRQHLADHGMTAEEVPEDDEVRQTYNFPPGSHGLIYRANTSERDAHTDDRDGEDGPSPKKAKLSHAVDGHATRETKYKLQAAKWGLIPFWTKRPPDYASQLRTINCRDDSLIENRGMWNTMKQRKRCVVVAEGFYEWLKKNNGKEKIPHFTKRTDGQMMCFAGLWDMVQYEGSDEKLYTYTIITTDTNKQLKFLHDRMPVILEPGSEELEAWLDPNNVGWSKELQSMLKPFKGELECYPVDKAVGKVGNNSPSFVVPIDSKENKNNIANFFGTQRSTTKDVAAKNAVAEKKTEAKKEVHIKPEEDEDRETEPNLETTEANAPLPKPKEESTVHLSQRINQDTADLDDQDIVKAADSSVEKGIKRELADIEDKDLIKSDESPPKKTRKTDEKAPSPSKKLASAPKTRSATTNNSVAKTPTKDGNAKITSFFGK